MSVEQRCTSGSSGRNKGTPFPYFFQKPRFGRGRRTTGSYFTQTAEVSAHSDEIADHSSLAKTDTAIFSKITACSSPCWVGGKGDVVAGAASWIAEERNGGVASYKSCKKCS